MLGPADGGGLCFHLRNGQVNHHTYKPMFFFFSVPAKNMFRVFEALLLNISKCGRQIKPSKPEVFTLWAFTEKRTNPLFQDKGNYCPAFVRPCVYFMTRPIFGRRTTPLVLVFTKLFSENKGPGFGFFVVLSVASKCDPHRS